MHQQNCLHLNWNIKCRQYKLLSINLDNTSTNPANKPIQCRKINVKRCKMDSMIWRVIKATSVKLIFIFDKIR